jgi:hypothetical protein
MTKFDLTAMLYSKKNYELEYKLHKLCQQNSINLVTVLDFFELAIKSFTLKPRLIFCDCSTVKFSSGKLRAFLEKEEFKNARIIFVGKADEIKAYKEFAINNLVTAEMCDLPLIIDEIQCELRYEEIEKLATNSSTNALSLEIYKLLCSIGFSAKHTGCAYLRECIRNVVVNNGVIHTLATDQYPYIAVVFKTSIVNVERNIRNAINCAWKSYGKDNWHKIFFSKSMEMGQKPTNREFIYMCSQIVQAQIASQRQAM